MCPEPSLLARGSQTTRARVRRVPVPLPYLPHSPLHAMVRGRPAPAPLDVVEDGATIAEEPRKTLLSEEVTGDQAEAPPVKNTFIEFGPEAYVQDGNQPVTAPGRMVGRVNVAFQHLATPTAESVVAPQRSTMSDGGKPGPLTMYPVAPLASTAESCPRAGEAQTKVISPPPMHTPHVRPADRPLLQAPPMISPKIPKEISFSSGYQAGIPPPPQASPVVKGSSPQKFNVAAPMLRADLAKGSLIEVTPVGQLGPQMAPPRCAPPSYMIGVIQTPTGGMTGSTPPPMHSPCCAAPASLPYPAPTTVRLLPGVAGCGRQTEVVGQGQLHWPSTPF